MTRSTRILLTALATLAVLAALAGRSETPAATAAVVRIDTSDASPIVGDVVTVIVRIRRAEHVGSAPFMLTYDPLVLEFIPSGSREGSFLREGGAATAFIARAGRAPGGITGVSVGLSRLGPGRGARGYGVLCTFKFRARSPGQSALGFSRAQLLDPEAKPLESTFHGATVTVRPVP